MVGVNRERLKLALKEAGRSARAMSLDAGLGETSIRDILSGKSRDPGAATLSAIAEQLGLPVESLLDGDAEAPSKARARGARAKELRLPILYEVAAGGFLERDDLPQAPYGYETVSSIAPYSDFPQWLERVVGDSMDRVIPGGSLLHVVDAIAIGYEARHGDIVVIERSRAQGALVERTVKQVELTHAGVELWPRSHNPRYQAAVVATPEGSDPEHLSVCIVGLVIRSYQSFVRVPDDPEAA